MLEDAITQTLSLTDLRPSPEANATMTRLVHAVVHEDAQFSTHPSTIQRVQTIASKAESELEIYWATKIIEADDPHAMLASFPYCTNYRELVRREIGLVERSGLRLHSHSRVLMIGSGPLPMTAFELMHQRGVAIDHVDNSEEAIQLCAQVSRRLTVECGHLNASGQTVALKDLYDVVIIAGLAGQTAGHKQAIIDNILPSLRCGGRVVVRSARGARELLYPAVQSHDFSGVRLLDEYHPSDEIINSVFIYEKA